MSTADREILPREVRKALAATGLSYTVEQRKRHRQIIIDGEHVCPLSNGPASELKVKMIQDDIRRWMRRRRA